MTFCSRIKEQTTETTKITIVAPACPIDSRISNLTTVLVASSKQVSLATFDSRNHAGEKDRLLFYYLCGSSTRVLTR